ncbi:helicase-related protein [Streptomyces sp. NPDC040750]|uniref:helicase-related protein n=1 Tax=Streptomyces sp. NPDC040750 TaxID=3154491 RepID=UPI0034106C48
MLASSRLIAEGIDIPSVDAVVFADPTRSVIRCVQALGRALRLDVSGKTASLIVPVHIPPGADAEHILGTRMSRCGRSPAHWPATTTASSNASPCSAGRTPRRGGAGTSRPVAVSAGPSSRQKETGRHGRSTRRN